MYDSGFVHIKQHSETLDKLMKVLESDESVFYDRQLDELARIPLIKGEEDEE